MTQDNTLARSLHDVGLATWFGGSLMGAVGLNGAAAVVDQPAQRLRVANAGWARWTPVNLAGIAAHVAGGAVLLGANKDRLASQRGVATATITKTAMTGLALAATAYSRMLGAKLEQADGAPVEDGTTPTSGPAISEEEHEVVLREEEPVVSKRAVPRERVRLDTETVTEERQVAEEVRKEQIQLEGDHDQLRDDRS